MFLKIYLFISHTENQAINLNLKKHSFFPYRKPNNRINYVNANSNHPPAILKQIPKMIENRLIKNSSSKKII